VDLYLAHFLTQDGLLSGPELEQLAADDVRGIETHFLYFRPWDLAACAELGAAARASRVAVHSVHAPFGPELNITAPDPLLRRQAMEAHRTVLRGAAALGAQLVVVHPGRELRGQQPVAEVADLCAEQLRQLAALAAELDLTLAVENMLPAHALADFEVLRAVVDWLDSPRVGLCLDTGHAQLTGGVDHAIEAFAGRLNHVHLQDNDGQADRHWLPSLGQIPWDGFAAHLAATGYTGPLTIEAYPPDGMHRRHMIPTVREALGV